MTTRVVHVKDDVPEAVYIGRALGRQGIKASKCGNPHKINNALGTGAIGERRRVIAQYKADLLVKRHLLRDLPDPRDKPLSCWCRHDGDERTPLNACHGDALIDLLRRYTDDELRAMGGDR